ncbi:glycoside hydrolase family 13 protein [Salinibacter sp.]|uniref:glycoside hydrolase family 13 protein n=1 Tax=Salinibacter sp. TaxID=2065818 RepID=UPI0021E942E8|nr:glycoside hydrolase family 13 protein [Salinibacter sp.]
MSPPDWAKHAVFYQIFPDRFARSGAVSAQENTALKPWSAPPEEQGFQGGDLYGIADRLDYLDALGVTALYLNPIFASAANHRYHTYDYYEVDPLLGGNDALRTLLDATHARGMRVVLDGVFNHASRGFWPFHHVLENGPDSPYVDWFKIEDWPLRPYAADRPHNYAAWHDIPALPELNTDHPPVRDFLFDVARHWVDFGIDGWRLDVPREIETDGFWEDFRGVVKDADPDAYLVGEIWDEAPAWLQGDRFDGLMNYPLLDITLGFFGAGSLRDYSKAHLTFDPLDAPAFARELERLLALYDWEAACAQLNLLDSHDMARAQWILNDHTAALRQAVLFLMTMPGAPCIYYGDEIGLSAAGDPHCREAFPRDEADWDTDLLSFYQSATALRHRREVLRTGRVEVLHADARALVLRRTLGDTTALVAFNAGPESAQVDLEAGALPDSPLAPAWPPSAEASLPVASSSMTLSLSGRETRVWTTA